MKIDWDYPRPRDGWNGALDRFVGPGATRAEIVLQFGFAAGIAVAAFGWFLAVRGEQDGWLVQAVILLIAFDMGGGVATNSTAAAKRWYHRAGQGRRQHLTFVAVHGLHILAVGWLCVPDPWTYVAVVYAAILAGAAAIILAPLYLQRPIALCLVALAIIASNLPLLAVPGLEWFAPLLALKLWAAHLLKEAPFAP